MNSPDSLRDFLGRFAAEGLDALAGAASDKAQALAADVKSELGLPAGGPMPPATFAALLSAAARLAGGAAQWVDERTALFAVAAGGRGWRVIALDRGPVVELVAPTDIAFVTGREPDGFADFLLARNAGTVAGAWARATQAGRAHYCCRATLPVTGLSAAPLHQVACALAAEAGELSAALGL